MIDVSGLDAGSVRTIAEFKAWTREKIRPVFPHRTLGSGYGHLHAGGVALDYVVTIDYPVGHLDGIRNRAGGIDTPILRRWLATHKPQLFEADDPWPDVPAEWLSCFRRSGLENAAAHAIYDTERCIGTYHSFHRVPGKLGAAHLEALKVLVPVMHEVLCNVIDQLHVDTRFGIRRAGLSLREQEITRWVGLGKTNSEIAALSGLSESTVKHYLTGIFSKLAVQTRAQLVHRLAEHARAAPGFATKIL
jgi:DNA-binding CsgD family transcriptional regulator